MLKKLTRFIKPAFFDLYATTPEIQVQGEPKSSSNFGIFSTFLVCGFVIWATVVNASELFQKKNPSITTANLPASEVEEAIELTPDVFDFTFGILNFATNTFYINSSIYTVQVMYASTSEAIPLDIEECNPEYREGPLPNIKGPTWCLKKNQTHSSKINIRTLLNAQLQIVFSRCIPSNTTVCASSNEIDATLRYSAYGKVYSDWKIDPFDYQQPLERYYKADWNYVMISQTKVTYMYLTTTEFSSDSGWILSDTTTQNIVTVGNIETDSTDALVGTFGIINIVNSGNKGVYMRTYIRLQDVLAQIGSLCSGFIFLLGVLVKPYCKMKMYESLVNQAFHIRDDHSDNPYIIKDVNREDNTTVTKKPDETNHYLDDMATDRILMKEPEKKWSFSISDRNGDMSVSKLTNQILDSFHQSGRKNSVLILSPPQSKEKGLQSFKNLNRRAVTNSPSPQTLSGDIVEIEMHDMSETSEKPPDIKDKDTSIQEMREQIYKLKRTNEGFTGSKPLNRLKLPSRSTSQQTGPGYLRIGFFEYLYSFIRPRYKVKMIERGSEQIKYHLDFIVLFQKLHQIDQLKEYLMTPEQQILFDKLRKPALEVSSREDSKRLKEGRDREKRSGVSEVKEAYVKLKKKKFPGVLDMNLMMSYERNKDRAEVMGSKVGRNSILE